MIQGTNPGRDKKLFSSLKCADWLWSPPNLFPRGTRALSTRFEACHLPLSCAEVKNEWRNTSIPPSGLHGLAQANLPFSFLAKTLVYISRSTRHLITEGSSLHSHCFEILKSHLVICVADLAPGCTSKAPKHGAAVPHSAVK